MINEKEKNIKNKYGITKEFLIDKYWNEEQAWSTLDLKKYFGCDHNTILYYFKKYDIKMRTKEEAQANAYRCPLKFKEKKRKNHILLNFEDSPFINTKNIAEMTGLKESCVYQLRSKLGIKKKSDGVCPYCYRYYKKLTLHKCKWKRIKEGKNNE